MATEFTLIQYPNSYDLKLHWRILPYRPEEYRIHHLRAHMLPLLKEQAQNAFILTYKARRKIAPTPLDRFQEV